MPGKHLRNLRGISMRCRIVQSAQKAFSVKVEGLHGGMSGHPCWKYYAESPQALAAFAGPRKLLGFEVRIGKDEWRRQVVPDQITTIVCKL